MEHWKKVFRMAALVCLVCAALAGNVVLAIASVIYAALALAIDIRRWRR